jgi:hypothetical protein
MSVGMTDSGGVDADEHFPVAGLRSGNIVELDRRSSGCEA